MFLARCRNVAVGPEFEAEVEVFVPPRNRGSDSDVLNARQLTDPPRGFPVKIHYLNGRFSVMHHRHIDGEHMVRIQRGPRGLERKKRLHSCAGRRHQHKRGRDLNHRENPQFPIRDPGDARAPASQAESLGASRGRQARNECQQRRRNAGQVPAPTQSMLESTVRSSARIEKREM